MSLKLNGQMLKANIFANGELIGRWISDGNTIKKGNYFKVDRKAWTLTDVDHFPLMEYPNGFKLEIQLDSKGDGILKEAMISLAREIILSQGEVVGQYERKYSLK
eukprot:NODE_179_length_13932_cov_0.652064.p10 type:complete len:105 gc:universal NODE_179_length_13932_cov_0.652064:7680-7366(-)